MIDLNTPSRLLPFGCKIYGFKFASMLSGISIMLPAPAPASTTSGTSASAKAAPTKPATGKLGSTTFERRTPTSAEFKAAQEYRSANPNAKPEDVLKAAQEGGKRQASVDADLAKANTPAELNKKAPPGTALAKEQERREEEKRKRAAETAGTTAESYDAYDIVLDYLFANGHVDTLSEAHYVMLEMDAEFIQSIVESSATLSAAARRRAQEMGAKRRRTPAYRAGGNRGTGRNERAAYNLSNAQRSAAANPDTQRTRSRRPSTEDTGMHSGDYNRFNRSKPENNPKHEANN